MRAVILCLCAILGAAVGYYNPKLLCGCQNNDPVCGNDGKTYGSACQFHCGWINEPNRFILHKGRCLVLTQNRQAPLMTAYRYDPYSKYNIPKHY